jgi:polysaccharide biosynthesis protein PslH
MRIVYLTGMLPARMNNGTEIATRMIADMLREQGHSVVMAGYTRPDDILPGCETIVVDRRPIEFVDASRIQKVSWAAEAVLRHEPLSVSKYRHPNAKRLWAEMRKGVDCFIVDKPQIAVVFQRMLAKRPFSVIWHAIEHQTYGAVARDMHGFNQQVYRREARLAKRMERRVAQKAQHVFTLTPADAKSVVALNFGGHIDVAPMIVPSSTPIQQRGTAKFDYDIGLLGNWTWSANASGLEWFLRKVRPLLPPNLSIAIGGRGAESVAPEITNVNRVGYVEDARVFLGRCRVVAIPLLAGTGVSMKVLEAAYAGWPVVTTTIGARGIGDLPENVRIVDDPTHYAQSLRRMSETDSEQRRDWMQSGDTWMQSRRLRFSSAIASGVSHLASAKSGT